MTKQTPTRLSKEERQQIAQKKAKNILIQAWVITSHFYHRNFDALCIHSICMWKQSA